MPFFIPFTGLFTTNHQPSSSLVKKKPAQERVFEIAELLEKILSSVNKTELLVNMQRVSKQWRDVIKGSPSLQKGLFFRASPNSMTPYKRYIKNLKLASVALPFFSVYLFERNDSEDRPFTHVWMRDIIWHFHSDIIKPWLFEDASWRDMYVSQPPIKRIFWQIRRDDQMCHGLSLPTTIAEFEFPEGLRMGDYYDLILGTRGRHQVSWPSTEKWPRGRNDPEPQSRINPDSEARWKEDVRSRAYKEHAIVVEQHIVAEEANPKPSRDEYWNPKDLRKYQPNLRMVKELEAKKTDGVMNWGYKWLGKDSASGMKMFLHRAQKWIPELDDYYC
ncbi:hypothetical protein F5Y00DRAFT_273442 [Daldinia vernicosa]|uniref:uncharacterized protein n=1 Tax=Daldinia vernicosa TaxID=114800 RepID=UPI002007A238|nr:uncharacterized protein F5Y00DRAFT_273442 [Daldinia vernicosa]KAI0844963.1 hypothetical protein F5Y00DRAFT_273442 [Daldinia vernicosa]